MRQALALGILAVTATAATPALAERYTLARPSPCDKPIPTGRTVPRQAIIDAVGDVLMQGTVMPTWRDKPIGLAGNGERVTILQECGFKLRIRNVRGLEGWISTVAIPDERKAYEAAKNRPPETIADCELLYLDPVVVDRCKIKFDAERAHQGEVEHSPYLSADELHGFVIGRTMTLKLRFPKAGDSKEPLYSYGAPDGEYFLMQGSAQANGMRHRGRYELIKDGICFPSEGGFCGRVRKVGDDRVWATANGTEYTVTGSDGDPFGVVAAVSKWQPNPRLPAPPPGTEDVAGPQL